MKIFAISDLHLSTAVEKPMDIFGAGWENHFEKICEDWRDKVSNDDLVLLGGDISWGMTMDEAAPDYALIDALPGKKIVGKGNHDYYWSSLSKMQERFKGFRFLQNNAFRADGDGSITSYAVALRKKNEASALQGGARGAVIAGTRGWTVPCADTDDKDKKIYERDLTRLDLSLSSAKKLMGEGDELIALLHFPPFDAEYHDSEVTALLEKYGVKRAVYGHLHGKGVRVTGRLNKNGIEYILTSCDLVNNKLSLVCEI